MKNTVIKYPLVLGSVALVAGLLLALVFNVTSPVIEKNTMKRENAAIVEILGENIVIDDKTSLISKEETNKGINNFYKVSSGTSTYYVYKLTVQDGVGSDDSDCILVLKSDGKIYKVKFTSTGDQYAKNYDDNSYLDSLKDKNSLSSSDVVSGATSTGDNFISIINEAIGHYGRNK